MSQSGEEGAEARGPWPNQAQCVCNDSTRFRGTVTLAQTYASALDQTGAKIFWASVAINNYIVLGADASNAFAEGIKKP